ncbi:MAG: hypothetical protein U0575_17100 [Phycisphaerales bacterium]
MTTSVFRFTFASGVGLCEVESTLQLSILAAEGLFGEARVRMDASYLADAPRSVIVVDGSTPVGDAIVRIYTGFLTREIGPEAFHVRRMTAPPSKSAGAAIGAAA